MSETPTARLLLVEDDPADQALVRRGFRAAAPGEPEIDVVAVETVDAALARLQDDSFAIVVTDYTLPDRNGLELLRALQHAGNPMPVVVLTGTADINVAAAALQEGAADFVLKDVGFEEALATVVRRRLAAHHAMPIANPDDPREQIRRLESERDAQARELRHALQESEALRRLAQALASASEVAAVLELVTRTTAQLMQAQAAAVLFRRGSDHVLANAWTPRGTPAITDPQALGGAHWVAAASAPLDDDGQGIGIVWAGRTRHGAFAARDHDLLKAVADLTALSVAKLRTRDEIHRLRPNAPATRAVGRAAAEHPPRIATGPAAAQREAPVPREPQVVADTPAAVPNADGDPNTILVVDDSENVLLQARLALQSAYTVLTATSGEAALQKYAATRPGVVVVDVAMPGMDGPTTIAELRKLGCRTCVGLALRGDAGAQELARKAGCVAVVEKPLRAPELVAQIAALQEPLDPLATDQFTEDDGYAVVRLDNASPRVFAKLLPACIRRLRGLAEECTDRLIVDAAALRDMTPEHVAVLVRLYAEASALGIRTAICAADADVVTKLRQIVELRDAQYVLDRDAAKRMLAS